jgi:acyl-CoA thioester hydrolase
MLPIPTDRKVFNLPIKVLPADIDELNHVNNVVYLRWVQEVAFAHWDTMAPEEMKRQCNWVVLRHEIDYHAPALPGDLIEASTWIDPAEGVRHRRYVSIKRLKDSKVLATACTTWCLLDPKTGRPKRISNGISAALGLEH